MSGNVWETTSTVNGNDRKRREVCRHSASQVQASTSDNAQPEQKSNNAGFRVRNRAMLSLSFDGVDDFVELPAIVRKLAGRRPLPLAWVRPIKPIKSKLYLTNVWGSCGTRRAVWSLEYI